MDVVRAQLRLTRSRSGRLEGSLVGADGRAEVGFSGTLELLRALEELVPGLEEDTFRDHP